MTRPTTAAGAVLALALCCTLAPASAHGQEPARESRAADAAFASEARRTPPQAAQLLASNSLPLLRLGAAVALVICAGTALTAWARTRGRRRSGLAGTIDVIAMRGLGPRHRVAVIETGGRRLLIGLSNDGIRPLLDLSEGAEFAHALGPELPADARPEEPLGAAIGRFEGLDG